MHIPAKMRETAKKYDLDESGTLDSMELLKVMQDFESEQAKTKQMARVIMGLVAVNLIELCMIFCLVILAVELGKEAKVEQPGTKADARLRGLGAHGNSWRNDRRRRTSSDAASSVASTWWYYSRFLDVHTQLWSPIFHVLLSMYSMRTHLGRISHDVSRTYLPSHTVFCKLV